MPKPFPSSMCYDDQFEWWRGTIKLLKFDDVRIDVSGRKSTSRTIELLIDADNDGPSEAQAAAYIYCVDNQSKVLDACFRGIAKTANRMRSSLAKWNTPERLEGILPKTPTPDKLRSRIRLTTVRITNREKNRLAHIEYSFNCAWDQEHGLLVVIHRDRLVFSGLSGSGW